MFRLPNCNELNAFYRFHSDAEDDVVEITQIRSLIDSERLELNSNASNVLYALQRAKTLDATWNASSGLDALCVVDKEDFLSQLCLIITANELGWNYENTKCTMIWFPFKLLRHHFIASVLLNDPVEKSSYELKTKRILQLIALFIAAGYSICECEDEFMHPPGVILAELFVSFDFSHLLDFFVKANTKLARHTDSLHDLDEPERRSRVAVIREKERPQVRPLTLLASYVVRANLRTNAFAATRLLLDQGHIPQAAADYITLGVSKKSFPFKI